MALESDKIKVFFVTGNKNKLREVQQLLSGTNFVLTAVNIDLEEIQAPDSATVVAEKCRKAALITGGPTIVEDTSLEFEAMGGLPGAFIKFFLEKIGNSGLNQMLDGFEDRTAYAVCALAFTHGPHCPTQTFEGRVEGRIVSARGNTRFGWDPIFEPVGFDKTFGEMSEQEKNSISHRARAVHAFSKFHSPAKKSDFIQCSEK